MCHLGDGDGLKTESVLVEFEMHSGKYKNTLERILRRTATL